MLLMTERTTRQKVVGAIIATAAGITTVGVGYVTLKEVNPFTLKSDHEDSMDDLQGALSKISASLDTMYEGICRNTLQRMRSQAESALISVEAEERKDPPDYVVLTALRRSHSSFLQQYEFELLECGFTRLATTKPEVPQ